MSDNAQFPSSIQDERQFPAEWLIGVGETGELICSMDWSATPLGSRDAWPQSLRTVVNLVLSSSYPMAILWGNDLRLIYNDAYGVVAADRHPKAMGRSAREVWLEAWEFNKPVFERVMRAGETVYFEDQPFHILRNGCMENAHFTLSYSPIWIEDGRIGGTLLVFAETTQRVLSEQRLKLANETLEARIAEQKRTEEALRERVKELNCLRCISDLVGREDSLENVLQGCAELMPDAWCHPEIACARIVFGGRSYQTGNFRESDWRQSAALKVNGRSVGVVELCYLEERRIRDEGPFLREERNLIDLIAERLGRVVERKRAEEELLFKENIIECSSSAIATCDLEGKMTYGNPSFLKTWGFNDPEEYLGRPFEDLWSLEGTRDYVMQVLRSEGTWFGEIKAMRKDGSIFDVMVSAAMVFDSWGNPAALTSTSVDITDRKQAEADKAKLEAQLQQAQKMESVGRLAGGVAHDFNNMLGVILGHAELALMQVTATEPLHDDLQEIRKAAERSADLTRQLLAFARRQTAAPKVLDLNQTVTSMLNMLQRLIGEDISLNWQPSENLWPVKIDPSQIDQILANLCVNARDAIEGVGKVTIETGNSTLDEDYCAARAGFVPGEYVRLAVSDDGCGMDKDTLANIFEPFFTTKGIGKGTGLGLATVYGIVKQNNSFINVYSEPGQGTTFTIYLPRHVSKAEQAVTGGSAEPAKRGHETILLVEDELSFLKLTAKVLENQGYTVLAASTPGEAIRLAKEHGGEIHLLMTDVVMPEMNGQDLAKHLLSLYPHIKRLFTSGYTADVIAHHGVLDEGVHFIQKPFSVEDLAIKLRAGLDSDRR